MKILHTHLLLFLFYHVKYSHKKKSSKIYVAHHSFSGCLRQLLEERVSSRKNKWRRGYSSTIVACNGRDRQDRPATPPMVHFVYHPRRENTNDAKGLKKNKMQDTRTTIHRTAQRHIVHSTPARCGTCTHEKSIYASIDSAIISVSPASRCSRR